MSLNFMESKNSSSNIKSQEGVFNPVLAKKACEFSVLSDENELSLIILIFKLNFLFNFFNKSNFDIGLLETL